MTSPAQRPNLDDVQTRRKESLARDNLFGDIFIYPTIAQGTIITWQFNNLWQGELPHDAELICEFNESPVNEGWQHVWSGSYTQTVIIDRDKHFSGMMAQGVYRLRMKSREQEWVSAIIRLFGRLSFHEWKTMCKIVRAQTVFMRHSSGTPGFLLQRRQRGIKCTCSDFLTGDPKQTNCDKCYGTGFLHGYYSPVQSIMSMSPKLNKNTVEQQQRGPIEDVNIQGQILAVYGTQTFDVWCDALTGDRYTLHGLQATVDFRGMPVVYMVELRKINYSQPVYKIAVS